MKGEARKKKRKRKQNNFQLISYISNKIVTVYLSHFYPNTINVNDWLRWGDNILNVDDLNDAYEFRIDYV